MEKQTISPDCPALFCPGNLDGHCLGCRYLEQQQEAKERKGKQRIQVEKQLSLFDN